MLAIPTILGWPVWGWMDAGEIIYGPRGSDLVGLRSHLTPTRSHSTPQTLLPALGSSCPQEGKKWLWKVIGSVLAARKPGPWVILPQHVPDRPFLSRAGSPCTQICPGPLSWDFRNKKIRLKCCVLAANSVEMAFDQALPPLLVPLTMLTNPLCASLVPSGK